MYAANPYHRIDDFTTTYVCLCVYKGLYKSFLFYVTAVTVWGVESVSAFFPPGGGGGHEIYHVDSYE